MVLFGNRPLISSLVTFLLLLISPLLLHAADDMWDSVFKYQQQMADYGKPEAQIKLGEMYEEGHGTEQNFDIAEQWYRKALGQGEATAEEKLNQLQQRRQQTAEALKAQQYAAQQRIVREKAERKRIEQEGIESERAEQARLADEARLKQEQKRRRQQAEDKRAAEDERLARKRAQQAMEKMMATPDAFDED